MKEIVILVQLKRRIMMDNQGFGHTHDTGETVMISGFYTDADGEHIELEAGQKFPNCPKSGKPTKWRHGR
jgi:hypothetical protein